MDRLIIRYIGITLCSPQLFTLKIIPDASLGPLISLVAFLNRASGPHYPSN